MVTDNEESVKNALREILKSKNKGHEYALDLTRIKDKDRRTEIMKRLTRFWVENYIKKCLESYKADFSITLE